MNLRSEPKATLARPLPTRQTLRKGRLNFLYPGVKAVCMDMWEPFARATATALPDGERKIVHDRFHVMQHANKAVNAVRIKEARALAKAGDDRLKGSRQLWLYGQENVPDKRRADFQALLRADLETSRAWAAKETLRRTWQQPTVEAARAHVTAWLKHVADSLQGPMHAFSLLVWWLRSHGEAVEVIAPAALRQRLAGEFSALAARYSGASS